MGTRHRGTPREVRALDAYVKLMRCSESILQRMERRLVRLGLTENQFGVLETLYFLGPLAQHALGAKLLTSRANITTVVDNLEKRGLARRERNAADRRSVTVHLTAEGRSLLDRIWPGHADAITEALSPLDAAEQEQLGRLCKKLGLGVQALPERDPRADNISSRGQSPSREDL